jgi:hypothetical protein
VFAKGVHSTKLRHFGAIDKASRREMDERDKL